MSGQEVKKRVRFEKKELDLLQQLVGKYPDVEKKEHDKNNEQMKKVLWMKITDEFNVDAGVTKRSTEQLRNAWKRLKKDWKSNQAALRRKKFKTGGGPASPATEPNENDKIMEEVLLEQVPLESIPDDDFQVDEYDGSNNTLLQSNTGKLSPMNVEQQMPCTSSSTQEPKKTSKKVLSFAEEFHLTRMANMKEEHEMKMKILTQELKAKNQQLKYWQEMCASIQHPPGSLQMPLQPLIPEVDNFNTDSSEIKTFDLVKKSIIQDSDSEGD